MRLVPWPFLICVLFALVVDATRGYSVEVIPAVLVHEEHLGQNGANRHRGFRMVVKEPARQNLLAPGKQSPIFNQVFCANLLKYFVNNQRYNMFPQEHKMEQNNITYS